MELRNFTLDSSRARSGGYAADRPRDDAEEHSYSPRPDVPILDVDFSDDGAFEPDGVNDFVRRLECEELDQL